LSATWRRRRPVGLTRDGVPSNTAFFPRDAQDLAMSQVLSQCAWSDVCMHVAGLVPECLFPECFQRVFSGCVFRECFHSFFFFFSLVVWLPIASRWPLPLDGLCLLMVSRWPFDGLSMASRWPIDGVSHLPFPFLDHFGGGKQVWEEGSAGRVRVARWRQDGREWLTEIAQVFICTLTPKP
jgi:hypothetical protein